MRSLPLRSVSVSADLEKPGDFVFIKAREPERTQIRTPIEPPKNPLKRFFWYMFETSFRVTETLIPQWPVRGTVILLCPRAYSPSRRLEIIKSSRLNLSRFEPELSAIRIHFDVSDNKPRDGLAYQSPREIGTEFRYAVSARNCVGVNWSTGHKDFLLGVFGSL